MEISVQQGNIAEQAADCIVVNLFEGVTEPAGATGAVDKALNGAISRLIASGDFSGKAGSTALLYADGGVAAPRVLVVGLGAAEKFDTKAARKSAATVYKTLAKTKGVKHFATIVHGAGIGGLDPAAAAQALAEGTVLAAYRVPNYKREAPENGPERCTVVEFDGSRVATLAQAVQRGAQIGAGVNLARDLSNEPPNVLYPVAMAQRAQAMAEATGLRCTVLGEAEMSALNMNILLAVSRGSANEAQLVILEHAPAGTEQQAPLIFVGKGITFDTGGISIKPSERMEEMKHDMSGAAAVIGAMQAIAQVGVARRVIGVAACVENMPDGNAFRPGDILTGMTGKSTEILSTDAEGRLILADAVAYVARFEPKAVVDLATLTGAIGIALGTQAAGLFDNDADLQAALMGASAQSGERLWPMPMWEEYMEPIKGDMGEVKNSGGRGGGVSTSAKFIEHFTEGYPWAHLDIANVAWSTTERDAMTPKGATGFGVRLLVDLAESY
ncbi:MAG TPA: leucyl aminopeptidase [Caldilinea sp.]|nr:leucyl aminopeptidase [Caldilinea sp.]